MRQNPYGGAFGVEENLKGRLATRYTTQGQPNTLQDRVRKRGEGPTRGHREPIEPGDFLISYPEDAACAGLGAPGKRAKFDAGLMYVAKTNLSRALNASAAGEAGEVSDESDAQTASAAICRIRPKVEPP